ncbi:B12-binding domain-containing radical SAM protein [Candidatus Micrarchaeota archaeon]|nr:B12-binding domain-containing radical SAM protein [Candidatus Micrarchaeota archaeon]
MKVMLATPVMKERAADIQYIPLGLAYVASSLVNTGHEVRILDARILKPSDEEILRAVEEFSPAVFGVTATTCQIYDAAVLLKLIKSSFPEIKAVIGGPHVSALPQHTLKEFPWIDFVIVGEGEETASELVSFLEAGRNLSAVKGICYRVGKKTVLTPPREFSDPNKLPFPARELFPLDRYAKNAFVVKETPMTTIITSRGCPGGCVFCCKSTFGRKFRARSVENVLQEIELLVERGYREIHVVDDAFTLDRNRAKEILRGIISKGWNLNFTLPNGIRVDTVDEEMAALLKKAGFYWLWFGVESGDQGVINNIKKGIRIEQVRKAVKLTKKQGMFTGLYFIVGLLGSSPKTERKSLELALELDADAVGVSILTVYPGSELFSTLRKNEADWKAFRHDFSEHVFTGEGFDGRYILSEFQKFIGGFYLRPAYPIKMLLRHGRFGARFLTASLQNLIIRRLGLEV